MIDIETTGADSQHTNMIQLAAVAFNPEAMTVDPDMFCMSVEMQPGRFWDEGTRVFWNKMPDLLRGIQVKAQPAGTVMQAFQNWVLAKAPGGERLFWAKPSSFDFTFVESYFAMTGVASPFHFRTVIDMRSWLRAKLGTFDLDPIVKFEKSIPFQGVEHDARFDALHQVSIILKAQEASRS